MPVSTPHRSSISLIIPCYNDAKALSHLLAQAHTLSIDEVIVVDGGSYDGSQKCARLIPDVTLLSSKKGRGQQIAAGVAYAKSDLIWILHADSLIPANALLEINRIMANPNTVLGCFPLRFDADSRSLRLFAWLSKFDSLFSTFGDQGYFCRRKDYLAFGNGTNYPLLEDVAFRRFILKKTKGNVQKSTHKLTTSARRFQMVGPIRTQLYNARILAKYLCGASPIDLYNEYYADPLPQIFNDPSLNSRYSDLGKNKS